jgi:hypothetical protein
MLSSIDPKPDCSAKGQIDTAIKRARGELANHLDRCDPFEALLASAWQRSDPLRARQTSQASPLPLFLLILIARAVPPVYRAHNNKTSA